MIFHDADNLPRDHEHRVIRELLEHLARRSYALGARP